MILEVILTLAAFLTALAAAIMTPLVYLFGIDHVLLPNGIEVSLIGWGFLGLVLWGGSNLLSGLAHQTSYGLYRLDEWGSRIAFVSITATAAVIAVRYFIEGHPDAVHIVGVPMAGELLLVVVAIAWIDLFVIQWVMKRLGLVKLSGERQDATAWRNFQQSVRAGNVDIEALIDAAAPPGGYPEGHRPQARPSRTGHPEDVTVELHDVYHLYRHYLADGNVVFGGPTPRVERRIEDGRRWLEIARTEPVTDAEVVGGDGADDAPPANPPPAGAAAAGAAVH
ncbi:hypothetical protein C4585_02590 [Candidatus Parcubacteria bacterium]|nr:MAG: hypothetical protein C4585_02590 [Candidatus Parcubacteria bacterium]